MDGYFKWFGICTNGTNICEYEDNKKCACLYSGSLIKISPQSMPTNKELRLITLFNQQKQTPDSDGQIEKIFLCSETKFATVENVFWPYLIVETNLTYRLNVYIKREDVLSLRTGDKINIYMKSNDDRELQICCKIEYIGEVPEYGKGFFFCLRADNFEFGKNPQTNFIGKYARGPRTSLVILTASAFFEVIEFDDIINRPIVVSNQVLDTHSNSGNIQQLQAKYNELRQRLGYENSGNIEVANNTGAIRKNSIEKIRFNFVPMICSICRKDCPTSSGILLAHCGHMFCYDCLTNHINCNPGNSKICPFINKKYKCNSLILPNEVVCLNSEETKKSIEKNRNNRTDGSRITNKNIWSCSECTYENNLNAIKCIMCNGLRALQPSDYIQCMNCFDTCNAATIFVVPECNHNVCNNCLMVYLEYKIKDDVDGADCPIKFCDYVLKARDILEMFIQFDRFYIKNVMNLFDVCVTCQVAHLKITCKQFQQALKINKDKDSLRLVDKYDKLFNIGDVTYCPKCQLMIVKQGYEKEYCSNCKEAFKADYQPKPWQCGICYNTNNRSSNICGVCGKVPKNISTNKTAMVNCMFCTLEIKFTDGVTLTCSHFFCKGCLDFLVHSEESILRCPYEQNNKKCSTAIEQYEILQIVGPLRYKQQKVRLIRDVAKQMENSALCLNENCTGWALKEDLYDPNMFICTVCRQANCLVCEVVHAGMTCAVYNDPVKREEFLKPKPQQYGDLVKMDDDAVIKNTEPFECQICCLNYEVGEAVVLHGCLHVFCKECLTNHVKHTDGVEAKCPFVDDVYKCESIILEREIKAIVDEATYNQYIARWYMIGKNNIDNGVQCQTINCIGFWENDGNINEQECPICKKINCLNCQAIHPDMKCDEYQTSIDTKKKLEEEIAQGIGMRCPKCKIIIVRSGGCDWLQCTMCRTEICWVTKGPRWGPGGREDVSGGCRCRQNGMKCHPNCMNCH